jgi:hypothetical protein
MHDFGSLPNAALPLSFLRYSGVWSIGDTEATAMRNAALQLHFLARRVFLVLAPSAHSATAQVLLDGRPIPQRLAGGDVRSARLEVSSDRLYRLVDLPDVQSHTLTVEAGNGLQAYAFTFG